MNLHRPTQSFGRPDGEGSVQVQLDPRDQIKGAKVFAAARAAAPTWKAGR